MAGAMTAAECVTRDPSWTGTWWGAVIQAVVAVAAFSLLVVAFLYGISVIYRTPPGDRR